MSESKDLKRRRVVQEGSDLPDKLTIVGRTSQVRAGSCPGCGFVYDATTSLSFDVNAPPRNQPGEGDAIVCIECGTIALGNADGSFSVATRAQIMEFAPAEVDLLEQASDQFRTGARGSLYQPPGEAQD